MMIPLQPLVSMTLSSPTQAARTILAVAWPRQVLWIGMTLAIVLNSLIYSIQEILFPIPSEIIFPRFSPLGYFVVMMTLQVVFVYALLAAGRWLGGTGKIERLLAVVVWLLFLQITVHLAMTILFFIAPSFAGILNLATTLIGLFIFVCFINEALQLQSNWRAFGVLLMASIIIALALSFLLGLVGPTILGLSANV